MLFVCVENACRSQIAQGIANSIFGDKLCDYSAGSRPAGYVNLSAIEVLKEKGIDISCQKSKGFDDVKGIKFDYVVTMGCLPDGQGGGECPFYPAQKRLDWKIPDPKNKPIEFFRKVRDEIENKIKEDLIDEKD